MAPPSSSDASASRSWRLVTLNTWKGEGPYALRLHADVVALQEVFHTLEVGVLTGRTIGAYNLVRIDSLSNSRNLESCVMGHVRPKTGKEARKRAKKPYLESYIQEIVIKMQQTVASMTTLRTGSGAVTRP